MVNQDVPGAGVGVASSVVGVVGDYILFWQFALYITVAWWDTF